MKAIHYFYRVVFAIILLSINLGSANVSAQTENTLQLNVLQSDERETILELVVDGFQTENFSQDGVTYQRIIIENTVQSANIGEPQVPVFSTMIGLASPDNVSIEIVETLSEPYAGYDLPVLRDVSVNGDNFFDGEPELKVVTSPSNAMTVSEGMLPAHLAEISQAGYLRDQAFAQVRFYPVQYDAAHREVILNKHIIVKVTSSGENAPESQDRGNRPEFEEALKSSLVNYAYLARPAAEAANAVSTSLPDQAVFATTPALKITISQEGLYKLTYEAIVGAGFDPASIDSSTLKLTNRGTEVAILVQDGGDGHIDKPGDRILFFGEALNDVYTNLDVYWLTYSDGNGKRMTEQDGKPNAGTTPNNFKNLLHAEQDTYYWQTMHYADEGEDHWFWGGRLSPNTAGYPVSRTYTETLKNISTNSGLVANIRFILKGGSNNWFYSPDHHVRVYINNKLINDWNWNGFDILDVNQDISQSEYLVEGNNTIKFETVAVPNVPVDQIFVNWFEITYWDTYQVEGNQLYFHGPSDGTFIYQIKGFTVDSILVLDITDPINPIRFTNPNILPDASAYNVVFQDAALASDRFLAISESQFLSPAKLELDAPSSWKTANHAADYILITYDGFYDNVQPLVNFRESQGLQVEVVKVHDLYDEFNYGIFNPLAIRDFLIYAYQNWQPPAPLYVLLVGDAYQDYKDNFHTGSINYVPTQIVETAALGETPSDNWFVEIAGDDVLPDMYIGRLSAQTPAQVDTIVQKLIHYEQDENPSSWNTDALFVADDDLPSFESDSDKFAKLLPPWYKIKKIYAEDYPPGDPTQEIISTINTGSMMVNYLGHGAVDQWGKWSGGSILNNTSVTSLTNANKHTFVTIESCLNGFFPGNQTKDSLAEVFQRHNSGGAVAVWAPSGLSYANGHTFVISELYKAIYTLGIHGLGEATTRAKWNIYAQSSLWGDLVNTYILFGDPATRLGVEEVLRTYLPYANRKP